MLKAAAFRLSKIAGTRVPMTLAHVARSPVRYEPEVIDQLAESERTLHISFHHRYIDDGIMIWKGTEMQLNSWFDSMNNLADGMSITHESSETSVVFLDCLFYKGPGWESSDNGTLDVTCYKKAINKYLYKPANSASPTL